MSSIYWRALGDDFDRLHPKVQWRFGLSSLDERCHIGRGVMHEVWRGPWWTLPVLHLGSRRRILFPDTGREIPFTIANYAYLDRFGRETVTWSRRFHFAHRCRAFDATMIHSKERDGIIDYLGTHQDVAVDIDCSVDDDGAMCIRTGTQRLYQGPLGVRIPMLVTGVAAVRESWDEAAGCFRISVSISNDRFGPLFGYRGSFTVTEHPCAADEIPSDVLPVREELRD